MMKTFPFDWGVRKMINKDVVDMANETKSAELKALLMHTFLKWCEVNERNPFDASAIEEWLEVEVNEE